MAAGQSKPTESEGQSGGVSLGCARLGPSTALGTNGVGVSRREVLGAAVAIPLIGGEGSFDTGLRQAQPLLRMSGEGGGGRGPPPASAQATAGPPPLQIREDWAGACRLSCGGGGVEEAGRLCSLLSEEIGRRRMRSGIGWRRFTRRCEGCCVPGRMGGFCSRSSGVRA